MKLKFSTSIIAITIGNVTSIRQYCKAEQAKLAAGLMMIADDTLEYR
jgi:hypothetical protein